jgi:integrase
MTIKQENDGTFTVIYSARHPESKRPYNLKRIKVESRAQAKRVEAELIKKLNEKFRIQTVKTWKEVVAEFLLEAESKDFTIKTIENYSFCLQKHTGEWSDRFVDTITSGEIKRIIHEEMKSHSDSQRINVVKYLRHVFSFAIQNRYIAHNPMPFFKIKKAQKLKTVLSLEQAKRLVSQAKDLDNEWYEIWMMALYTGMRNGELIALTWDKVDIPSRRILVNRSWNNKEGFKSTKSGDDRYVEIAPDLIPILETLKTRDDASDYVLPRVEKWSKGEQARDLRMFLKGMGLPVVRFHDLRASWATMMMSLGVEPIKVMKMGGWKDLKTMDRYVRLGGIDIQGVTDNLKLT